MLALSKVKGVTVHGASVLVKAACEYCGELWPKSAVTIKGSAFKNDHFLLRLTAKVKRRGRQI
jgi:hypothetical protein